MTLRWLSDDTFEVDGVGYVCDQYGERGATAIDGPFDVRTYGT